MSMRSIQMPPIISPKPIYAYKRIIFDAKTLSSFTDGLTGCDPGRERRAIGLSDTTQNLSPPLGRALAFGFGHMQPDHLHLDNGQCAADGVGAVEYRDDWYELPSHHSPPYPSGIFQPGHPTVESNASEYRLCSRLEGFEEHASPFPISPHILRSPTSTRPSPSAEDFIFPLPPQHAMTFHFLPPSSHTASLPTQSAFHPLNLLEPPISPTPIQAQDILPIFQTNSSPLAPPIRDIIGDTSQSRKVWSPLELQTHTFFADDLSLGERCASEEDLYNLYARDILSLEWGEDESAGMAWEEDAYGQDSNLYRYGFDLDMSGASDDADVNDHSSEERSDCESSYAQSNCSTRVLFVVNASELSDCECEFVIADSDDDSSGGDDDDDDERSGHSERYVASRLRDCAPRWTIGSLSGDEDEDQDDSISRVVSSPSYIEQLSSLAGSTDLSEAQLDLAHHVVDGADLSNEHHQSTYASSNSLQLEYPSDDVTSPVSLPHADSFASGRSIGLAVADSALDDDQYSPIPESTLAWANEALAHSSALTGQWTCDEDWDYGACSFGWGDVDASGSGDPSSFDHDARWESGGLTREETFVEYDQILSGEMLSC